MQVWFHGRGLCYGRGSRGGFVGRGWPRVGRYRRDEDPRCQIVRLAGVNVIDVLDDAPPPRRLGRSDSQSARPWPQMSGTRATDAHEHRSRPAIFAA